MAAAIKMDELLVNWLGSDNVHEKVLNLVETHRKAAITAQQQKNKITGGALCGDVNNTAESAASSNSDGGKSSDKLNPIVRNRNPSVKPPETNDESETTTTATTITASTTTVSDMSDALSKAMSLVNLSDDASLSYSILEGATIDIPPFYRPAGTFNSEGGRLPPLRRRYFRRRAGTGDDKSDKSSEENDKKKDMMGYNGFSRDHQTWDGVNIDNDDSCNNNDGNGNEKSNIKTSIIPPPPPPPNSLSPGGTLLQVTDGKSTNSINKSKSNTNDEKDAKATLPSQLPIKDQVLAIYEELGQASTTSNSNPTSISSKEYPEDENTSSSTPHPQQHQKQEQPQPQQHQQDLPFDPRKTYLTQENFVRVTKEICRLPTFFNGPLYDRILYLWNTRKVAGENDKRFVWKGTQRREDDTAVATTKEDGKEKDGEGKQNADDAKGDGNDGGKGDNNQTNGDVSNTTAIERVMVPGEEHETVVTFDMFRWFWMEEMEDYDCSDRFFRLLKKPFEDHVGRDDFLPYIKELLRDHPGLEFLSSHAEFQDKYAITVITRIFYTVNRCHSGRITARQIHRSDLLSAFQQVDEEEDINKVTRYFSYEHFYVLYCRFWELDHDRDYRITREDLLKYSDHSLSHMIVDRIFDAAPRPFEGRSEAAGEDKTAVKKRICTGGVAINRDYLSYEDFIYFMLSEENKASEISVRYWFACIDVDGDGRLNNMEMRSFYAVQLHRMQCMGHEIVPFEDMLCQMIDMIKPTNNDYMVVEDFLQKECRLVSGVLFDALFNLHKYLSFEQRDPFMERQKREDEFETDWDRFAYIDYNRLAMEEEQREEEAMEIDWVTVDDEDEDGEELDSLGLGGPNEAPF